MTPHQSYLGVSTVATKKPKRVALLLDGYYIVPNLDKKALEIYLPLSTTEGLE
uniref:Uncharacterized protein n=1 Tax=viral metagenome TaxID=1070528 RepID=A0A6C0K416_9ZZZZ